MVLEDEDARALFAVIANGDEYNNAQVSAVVTVAVAVVVVAITGEEMKWRSTKQYSSVVS